MPNQYTKFQNASQNLQSREFRWKQWNSTSLKPGDDPGAKNNKTNVKSRRRTKQNIKSDPSNDETENRGALLRIEQVPGHAFRVDPFSAYPIVPTPSELVVIDFFLSGVSPATRQIDLDQPPPKAVALQTNPHIDMLLPFFMQHQVLFHALLATCQASILLSRGGSALEDQTYLSHRTKAVSGLRDKLSSQQFGDDAALLSVTMLLTAEYLTGNLSAVVAHVSGLNEMIRIRGGLPENTPWERFIKQGIAAFQTLFSLMTGDTPETLCPNNKLYIEVDSSISLEYPSHPFSTELCDTLSTVPAGFSDLILNSQLSTQTIAIITGLAKLHSKVLCGDEFGQSTTPTSVHPIQASVQRLTQNSSLTHIERSVCAGMLAYMFQFPMILQPNLFHDPAFKGFIEVLLTPHREGSDAERDALIWVLMVVEAVMALRPIRIPRSRALFTNAIKKYKPMKQWSTLEPILKRFFFTDKLLVHWRRWWQEAVDSMKTGDGMQRSPSLQTTGSDTESIHSYIDPNILSSPTTASSDDPPNAVRRCPFRTR